MEQLNDYADDRLVNGCLYCGGLEETRDHVPSRVLLDEPFPENLPIVWACGECNKGFSMDEEYVACLIEAVIAGSTEPSRLRRKKVSDIFGRSPALRARIDAAKRTDGDRTEFSIEAERIRNVVLKLARGHAAYELGRVCREEPDSIWWFPLILMSPEELAAYDSIHIVETFGEIGSRALQRTMVIQVVGPNGEPATPGVLMNDWVEVQKNRYRYLAMDEGSEVKVKIVIGEYLACQVTWQL